MGSSFRRTTGISGAHEEYQTAFQWERLQAKEGPIVHRYRRKLKSIKVRICNSRHLTFDVASINRPV
jgi:hypothetical protein